MEPVLDCIFCKIVNHQAPAEIAYEDFGVMAIVPLNPVTSGHIIVISKEHVQDFTGDPSASADTMFVASILANRLGGPWNLITSKGLEATQSVFHLHIHLVPRHEGDGLQLPWTGQSNV